MADPIDLSPEAVELLRRGAEHSFGLCCRPGEIRKSYPFLRQAERLGYVRFLDLERPFITEAGRAAIGAPSEAEADYAKLVLLCGAARKPLVPAKRDDPRTDFDYRSWKAMRWVCTLVVRQPDTRFSPRTVRVGKTLSSDPQFLGGGNSNIQPESDERFVLTLVPEWMTRPMKKTGGVIAPAIFSTYPLALDDGDPNFTDEQRATWLRLREVCISINSRIRNANRAKRQNLAFGQWA